MHNKIAKNTKKFIIESTGMSLKVVVNSMFMFSDTRNVECIEFIKMVNWVPTYSYSNNSDGALTAVQKFDKLTSYAQRNL